MTFPSTQRPKPGLPIFINLSLIELLLPVCIYDLWLFKRQIIMSPTVKLDWFMMSWSLMTKTFSPDIVLKIASAGHDHKNTIERGSEVDWFRAQTMSSPVQGLPDREKWSPSLNPVSHWAFLIDSIVQNAIILKEKYQVVRWSLIVELWIIYVPL